MIVAAMKYAAWLLLIVVTVIGLAHLLRAGAAGVGTDAPAWASPAAMAVRKVSQPSIAQTTPNLFNNLDCIVLSYRLVNSTAMRSGCFTETAFGMFDNDTGVAIFNGTDEGAPLSMYTSRQVLVSWPKALDLVSLIPVSTGGQIIGLYRNPLGALADERNALGLLTGKRLTTAPDLTLKDPLGNPLVVNSQTLAFSENGSWLVGETLNGSFVRINLATLELVAFAPAYGSSGSPALLKSRVAISEDGRFIAIANDEAGELKVYDLKACDGIADDLRPQHCQAHDYQLFLRQQIGGMQSVRRLRFITESLISIEVTAADSRNDGVYELAPTDRITALTAYIGLGDSYTSGEGAFDYLEGTDTADNMCHLSAHAYPFLLTHDLFSSAGGHSVACSGAVINDVGSISGNYRGQVRGVVSLQELEQSKSQLLESVEANFLPGYIAQQRFVARWQPLVTTVSVGGDDIGFGDIVVNCVEPHLGRHPSDNTCYNTYEDRVEVLNLIDRTVPRWTALYSRLKHEAPETQLYVIGYPQVVYDAGPCAANVHLNKNELAFAESVVDYLNQDIRKAALGAGVTYVDISQAFKGHRLCEAAGYDVAVNGLTAGSDVGPLGTKVFGKESYHPNALGQSLIEQAILKQTHNLVGANPADQSDDTSPALLNAPKSGRQIYSRIPDDNLTAGTGRRGSNMVFKAEGNKDGLEALATYTVRLDGPSGRILGTVVSDGAGTVGGSVVIPDNVEPGGHTIDVTGNNQGGGAVDVTQPIYVPAGDADSDGDGIDDIVDSCPGAENGGHDEDHDGIDDVCDPVIGPGSAEGLGPAAGGASPTVHKSLVQGAITTTSPSRPAGPSTSGTTAVKFISRTAQSTPAGHQIALYPTLAILPWRRWLLIGVGLWLMLLAATHIPKRRRFGYNK